MNHIKTRIRAARADEGPELTELALRAKSHWGYEAGFLAAARADLKIDAETIRSARVYVLQRASAVTGFYGLVGKPPIGRLEWMFLEPEAIGRGYGRLMWNHAIQAASAAGFAELLIESDRFCRAVLRRDGRDQGWRHPLARGRRAAAASQDRRRLFRSLTAIASVKAERRSHATLR